MLSYGKPEQLVETIQREIEMLKSLLEIDKKLDVFIVKKIDLLEQCIRQLKRLEPGEYQLIALDKCEIVPIW